MANNLVYDGHVFGGVNTVNGRDGDVVLDAGAVGAIPAASVGIPDGVATLDATGRIPATQIPGGLDDIVTVETTDGLPENGVSGVLYHVEADGNLYRWSGASWVALGAASGVLVLGETEATAYRGDRGKISFDHSQIVDGNPHGTTAEDVGAVGSDGTITQMVRVSTLPANPDPTILYLVTGS